MGRDNHFEKLEPHMAPRDTGTRMYLGNPPP